MYQLKNIFELGLRPRLCEWVRDRVRSVRFGVSAVFGGGLKNNTEQQRSNKL